MKVNLNLISDFNLETLKRIIMSQNSNLIAKIETSNFGQIYQSILEFKEDLNSVNFIWSLPENHFENFQKILNCEEIVIDELFEEVDIFADLILQLSKKCKFIFLANWEKLANYQSQGLLDCKNPQGINRFLLEINLRISKKDMAKNEQIFKLKVNQI